MNRNEAIRLARDIKARPAKYVLIDTETTGFGRNNEVIQFAAITSDGEELANFCATSVEPSHPKALEVHGLTPQKLKSLGAKPWPTFHGLMEKAIAGRIPVAYDARFDIRSIENTARRHGLSLSCLEPVCAMRMYFAFVGQRKGKLEGDHSALGDCRAMLRRIEEIASAELEDDVEAPRLPIPNAEIVATVEDLQHRLKRNAKMRADLLAADKVYKTALLELLQSNGLDSLTMSDGKKLQVVESVIKVCPKVSLESLPPEFVTQALDLPAIKTAILEADPKKTEWLYGMLDWQQISSTRTAKSTCSTP